MSVDGINKQEILAHTVPELSAVPTGFGLNTELIPGCMRQQTPLLSTYWYDEGDAVMDMGFSVAGTIFSAILPS